MAKTIRNTSGSTFGSIGTNGTQPIVFTPSKHSDGSDSKEPQK